VVEEVRHAGQVGQDVVAVEAHERDELPRHLKELRRDDEEQRVGADPEPDAEDPEPIRFPARSPSRRRKTAG